MKLRFNSYTQQNPRLISISAKFDQFTQFLSWVYPMIPHTFWPESSRNVANTYLTQAPWSKTFQVCSSTIWKQMKFCFGLKLILKRFVLLWRFRLNLALHCFLIDLQSSNFYLSLAEFIRLQCLKPFRGLGD